MKKISISAIIFLFIISLFGQKFSEGNLESIIQKAKSEDKIVFLKFYSESCSWCKKLDKEVLIPEIVNRLSRLVVLYKITDNLSLLEGELLLVKEPERGIKILKALLEKGKKEISKSAFDNLTRYYKSKNDYDNLISIYRKIFPHKKDEVFFLNSFACTMAEIDKNLVEVLEAAKKATFLSNENPEILDTLAEVYYKKGDFVSALKTIEKAIVKEPNDDYFKKQREKFSKETKAK